MKINIYLLAISVCLVATSCNTKKDSSVVRIKTVTDGRGGVVSYFYNPDKTLAYSLSAAGVKSSYKYNGKTINEEIVDSLHGQSVTSTIYLNSAGISDSSVTVTPRGTFSNVYNHDAGGYIVASKELGDGKVYNSSTSVIKDGNQVEASVLDSANQVLAKVYFEYFTDKPYSMAYENYGRKFLGTDSKNPIKNLVQVRATGDTIRVINFKYHFDDNGRISSKVVSDRSGMVLDSSTVTYY